ncbi:F-box domain [Dillenia turbinata]|uniref:F-box domain n=1 Tax=Dillenia turbinata TaxID=194707 RepID=A0AAN8VPW7_9MAGN
MGDSSKQLIKFGTKSVFVRESTGEERKPVNLVLEKKIAQNDMPYIHDALMFKIFLLLPAKPLLKLSSVCKAWHKIIKSSDFIETHLRGSKTMLIFLNSSTQRRHNCFTFEGKLGELEPFTLFPGPTLPYHNYMCLVDIQDGRGKICDLNIICDGNILASCNGLVLLKRKLKNGQQCLFVINPMTRKIISIPLGTICSRSGGDSYGFMFCPSLGKYKVVHLFRDTMSYIGCEILTLGAGSWKEVDGPSSSLLRRFKDYAVPAIGALHWLPATPGSEYIVSMGIEDEKFHKKTLPNASGVNDGLVEMGEFLCFVNVGVYQIDLWTLKDLHMEDWVKQHTIILAFSKCLIPVSSLQNGKELVFKKRGGNSIYVYDCQLEIVQKVVMETGSLVVWGVRLCGRWKAKKMWGKIAYENVLL